MKKIFFAIFLLIQSIFADTICDAIKSNPNAFLKDNADLAMKDEIFSCKDSFLSLDYIKKIFEVSKTIRGENINCVGSHTTNSNLNKFISSLIKASYTPNAYAKSLPSIEQADSIREAQRGYFRYWGYSSFYNYTKFKEFWNLFNQAQTPLVKFYENKGYKTLEAAYYATAVLNEFLNYAVGDYPEILTSKPDISNAQKLISSNSSFEQIMSILYSKNLNKFELSEILNTALLVGKDEAVLNEILKRGADVNFGDETAIFFALNNINNVEFLLKNGANVNHKNAFGKSVIFYAVELKDIKLINLLIKYGANVNDSYIDQNTKTALLNLGSNLPFYLNMCGLEHTKRTLFMHAAAHANPEILQILLNHNSNANATDEIGFNANDYAIMANNNENLNFLESIQLKANIYLGVEYER